MNLFSIWLKELKSFFQYDAKNWTFLVFQYDPKNWTFFKMLKELNLSSIWITFLHDSNWTLFWSIRLKELNFFSNNDSKRWTPFGIWLKELNLFCIGLKELNFFQPYYSKNWALFCMSPKLNFSKKKKRINPIPKMTQRIELFRDMTHRIEFFETKKTHRSEPFFSTWLTVLNPSFQHDSKNDFYLIDSKNLNWISRIWLKELSPNFLKNDSKNWTFSEEWLKELNLVSKEKSQKRVQLFLILK